ncbi:pantetheine-phosphate adenylyltransferase [Bacteriovorax sp. Seq25_V]|uniref:pantetheine-phosphate adenylyltransferase n=1 Tax=Bacteriovorax sp. Seq25_V TaxID=1201288 RepID=UPI00038A1C3B|nr:pantetheine-phosphate adenylyltransferase [Bacteriovorax sp. Seq25_V]EQC46591.1 pantetheine-phosphate adenylyltransferase [Bacteriovorax sp. Seq25_V]
MKKALYAGTFDPFTNGHQDILLRSLSIFDEVTVLVANNRAKTPLFSAEDRVEMIKQCYVNEPKIKVAAWEGLVVDYAKKNGIETIIRGLRPTGDFEAEFQMASMNRRLYHDIETVFLVTEGENYYVSSSLVKEIFKHGRDVKEFLPEKIHDWLIKNGKESL